MVDLRNLMSPSLGGLGDGRQPTAITTSAVTRLRDWRGESEAGWTLAAARVATRDN
jgi:hypothetical protein